MDSHKTNSPISLFRYLILQSAAAVLLENTQQNKKQMRDPHLIVGKIHVYLKKSIFYIRPVDICVQSPVWDNVCCVLCRTMTIVVHIIAVRQQDCRYILGQFSDPFESAAAMIEHYSRQPLKINGAPHTLLTLPVSCVDQLQANERSSFLQ